MPIFVGYFVMIPKSYFVVNGWVNTIYTLHSDLCLSLLTQTNFHPHQQRSQKIDLYVNSFKEGQKRGFDPSLRKNYVNNSLACRTFEPILKVG